MSWNLKNVIKYLSQPVEWEPGEEYVWKELDGAQIGKNNPISQPFSVIFFLVWLNRLNRSISRIDKSNGIAKQPKFRKKNCEINL